jgi:hypothetical protein
MAIIITTQNATDTFRENLPNTVILPGDYTFAKKRPAVPEGNLQVF